MKFSEIRLFFIKSYLLTCVWQHWKCRVEP